MVNVTKVTKDGGRASFSEFAYASFGDGIDPAAGQLCVRLPDNRWVFLDVNRDTGDVSVRISTAVSSIPDKTLFRHSL